MIITEMNTGTKIAYSLDGTKLDIGDGALTIDLSRWQKDYVVTKDIMADREGDLAIGTGDFYIVEIVIPAIEYDKTTETTTDEEGNEVETVTKTAQDLDTDDVELKLFSIDGIKIN